MKFCIARRMYTLAITFAGTALAAAPGFADSVEMEIYFENETSMSVYYQGSDDTTAYHVKPGGCHIDKWTLEWDSAGCSSQNQANGTGAEASLATQSEGGDFVGSATYEYVDSGSNDCILRLGEYKFGMPNEYVLLSEQRSRSSQKLTLSPPQ